MNARPALVSLLAATALGLAACSYPASNPQAAASPTHWPRVSCGQASASDVGAALGLKLRDPQEVHQDPVTVCTYVITDNTGAVLVRYQTAVDATSFANGKSGYTGPVTAVTGLADEAYSNVATSGKVTTNTIAARQGTLAVTISSPAPLDKEKALVQKLIGSTIVTS